MQSVSRSTIFIFLSIVSGINWLSAEQNSQNTQPSFSITIKPELGRVSTGKEAKLTITLTNITDHEISVATEQRADAAELDYKIEIRDVQGKAAALKNYGRALRGQETPGETMVVVGAGIPIVLRPGEALKESTILNKVADLTLPGQYSIQVERVDEATKKPVKSNVVTITVIP